MTHYFFDLKSSDTSSIDEEGIELFDAGTAHEVALDVLLTAASKAIIEGSVNQHIAVEARDSAGPVLEVAADFHSRIFRTQ